MFNLKKTAFTILALAGHLSFAGTMGITCSPGNVSVPCENDAWDFGISGLYLQAVGNQDFAYNDYVVNNSNDYRYYDRTNKWGWGFMLEGSWHFGTGNDINLNWYHYKSQHTYLGRDRVLEPFNDSQYFVHYKPRWDAVNLEFAQHVDFSPLDDIRFHGGIQFARVTHNVAHFNTIQQTGSIFTRFTGIGPRMGADAFYKIGHGISIYAKGAAAILVGNTGFATSIDSPPALVRFPFIYRGGSRPAMSPELETKLGATYNFLAAQGIFGLDLGYMWLNYFNMQQIVTQGSDFALHGVYFGLKYTASV